MQDMTFQQLLSMCKEFCHIDDSSDLWLVDKHSGNWILFILNEFKSFIFKNNECYFKYFFMIF